MWLKYTRIKVIVVFVTLCLLFLGRSFPQLNLNDVSRNCLVGNGKKIAKFLMRTFTCRSTFLYVCWAAQQGLKRKWAFSHFRKHLRKKIFSHKSLANMYENNENFAKYFTIKLSQKLSNVDFS
jgi:hypothetical protein